MNLKDSDVNHLRRLLGYVRCEIGQTPEEFKETLRTISPAFAGERVSDDAYGRCLETYQKAQTVPKYVRAAVKALGKVLGEPCAESLDICPVCGGHFDPTTDMQCGPGQQAMGIHREIKDMRLSNESQPATLSLPTEARHADK